MFMMEVWDGLLMGVGPNDISKDPPRLFFFSFVTLLIIMITIVLKLHFYEQIPRYFHSKYFSLVFRSVFQKDVYIVLTKGLD